MKKSQLVGFLLTLFFGPVGLFYSSVPAALGFLAIFVFIDFAPIVIRAQFLWSASILVSFFTVKSFNSKAAMEESRRQERLQIYRQRWTKVAMEENHQQELLAVAREKQREWDGAPERFRRGLPRRWPATKKKQTEQDGAPANK